MSLLEIGKQCSTCSLVDFLPFTCPHCARVFCKDHIHGHEGCTSASDVETGTSTGRKRVRGTCAKNGCSAETIESIGGLDLEDGDRDSVARQVRCICGEAFCIAHRAQDAHDCPAPREDTARYDAGEERKLHAQEVLQRTMPEHAGKARMTMPKQVDRTRSAKVDQEVLPPSVIAERAAEAQAKTATDSTDSAAPAPVPAPETPPSASPTWTESPIYAKLHKLHCVKIRSLSKPLDPRAPRDQSLAVEWTVDLAGERVRGWSSTEQFKPDKAAAALGERKPERIWVPEVMPGGKLFDTLVAAAKLPREKLTLMRVSLLPGPQAPPAPIDLALPAGKQLAHGDVLVLVRA